MPSSGMWRHVNLVTSYLLLTFVACWFLSPWWRRQYIHLKCSYESHTVSKPRRRYSSSSEACFLYISMRLHNSGSIFRSGGSKHCTWRNHKGRNHILSGPVTGVAMCRCLRLMHDQSIDLVLLDTYMPVGGGTDLLENELFCKLMHWPVL
jgi:hypothetical protein